ncbi:unnamed protein product, partial [Symbiodinium sp. CCMP2456]
SELRWGHHASSFEGMDVESMPSGVSLPPDGAMHYHHVENLDRFMEEMARSPLSFKWKIHKMRLQDRFPFCSRCHQACATFFAQVL